ncbi:MAG: class I SAM-dependent methyltransferase [Pyrinomonadaceae bacterium]
MSFKDYFSGHAVDYAKYRPSYPRALFEYLASVAPGRERAWDCATGNGQAAHGLAEFFARVVATDASASQVENAPAHERITYRVAPAEKTDIDPGSVDLVTVAQALHWFDLDNFYSEVKRVLRPGGLLAVWSYNLLEATPAVDEKLWEFYSETVGPYWPPERRILEERYRTIPFPFDELKAPAFRMEARWTLPDLLGYLSTWSATKRYIAARGADPVAGIADELLPLWGTPEEEKPVRWPLDVRAGVLPPV